MGPGAVLFVSFFAAIGEGFGDSLFSLSFSFGTDGAVEMPSDPSDPSISAPERFGGGGGGFRVLGLGSSSWKGSIVGGGGATGGLSSSIVVSRSSGGASPPSGGIPSIVAAGRLGGGIGLPATAAAAIFA